MLLSVLCLLSSWLATDGGQSEMSLEVPMKKTHLSALNQELAFSFKSFFSFFHDYCHTHIKKQITLTTSLP